MAKKKISKEQKKSSRKSTKVALKNFNTDDINFKNAELIKEILIESLMIDDIETFKDILIAHLRSLSKTELARKTNIGRQTLYDLIDPNKEFNPRLSTLSAILSAIAS